MAGNPEYQNLDPAAAPPPVTPAAPPSSPLYGSVTPHGMGTAPYGVQAPSPLAEVSSAFSDANAQNGAAFDGGGLHGQGFLTPQSPRQAQTEALMESDAGFGVDGFDVTAGSTFGWPASVEPPGM